MFKGQTKTGTWRSVIYVVNGQAYLENYSNFCSVFCECINFICTHSYTVDEIRDSQCNRLSLIIMNTITTKPFIPSVVTFYSKIVQF